MDAGSLIETGLDAGQTDRLKVFVSYSRADVDFADQLVMALEDKGFDPILDRHDIDAAERWKERLGALIFSADTIVFVLTETSAGSPICRWEVEEAARLGKRMIPVTPRSAAGVAPPPQLGDLNYVHFYPEKAIPGSGFYDGVRRLDRALRVDLAWLRQQTTLAERALEWSRAQADDRLLRGAALAEAEGWLARTPSTVHVPPDIRAFLDASALAEKRRTSEAATQLAEREEALKRAEAAAAQVTAANEARVRASRRFRLFAVIALIVGVGLSAFAAIMTLRSMQSAASADKAQKQAEEMTRQASAGYSAAYRNQLAASEAKLNADKNAMTAAERQADVMANEARRMSDEGLHIDAMLLALSADPVGRLLPSQQSEGLAAAREALVLAAADNALVREYPLGGGEQLTGIAAHPSGKTFLLGRYDGGVELWSREGRLLRRLRGHTDYIYDAAFSRDGKRVLTVSQDKTARLWSADGAHLKTFQETSMVTAAAFMPDGRAVTGNELGEIRIWPADEGEPTVLKDTQTTDHSSVTAVLSIEASKDGKKLLAAYVSARVRLWEEGEVSRIYEVNRSSVSGWTTAQFRPDEDAFVVARRGKAAVWLMDPDKDERGQEKPTSEIDELAITARYLRGGRYVIIEGDNGKAQLWNVYDGDRMTDTPSLVRTFDRQQDRDHSLVVVPGTEDVLALAENDSVRLWATAKPYEKHYPGLDVDAVSVSADGTVGLGSDETFYFWPRAGREGT